MPEVERAAGRSRGAHVDLASCVVTGVGSVPHRAALDAATWSLRTCPDLPFVPQRPLLNPSEQIINQLLSPLPGASWGADGVLRGLPPRSALSRGLGPTPPPDLGGPAFESLRVFLDVVSARGLGGDLKALKWQLCGPITLGVALSHAGLDPIEALTLAERLVTVGVAAVHNLIRARLGDLAQVVVLDEPGLGLLATASRAFVRDASVATLASCLASAAALSPRVVTGVHCCAGLGLAEVLASGPDLVSIPLDMVEAAPSGMADLTGFITEGGRVAWGVVPTDRAADGNAIEAGRRLKLVWAQLIAHGVTADQLARQSLITPDCGLAFHDVDSADRVMSCAAAVAGAVAVAVA